MKNQINIKYIDGSEIFLIQDCDYLAIHPSQIDEVIQFLLAHKKQVEGIENKE